MKGSEITSCPSGKWPEKRSPLNFLHHNHHDYGLISFTCGDKSKFPSYSQKIKNKNKITKYSVLHTYLCGKVPFSILLKREPIME